MVSAIAEVQGRAPDLGIVITGALPASLGGWRPQLSWPMCVSTLGPADSLASPPRISYYRPLAGGQNRKMGRMKVGDGGIRLRRGEHPVAKLVPDGPPSKWHGASNLRWLFLSSL